VNIVNGPRAASQPMAPVRVSMLLVKRQYSAARGLVRKHELRVSGMELRFSFFAASRIANVIHYHYVAPTRLFSL